MAIPAKIYPGWVSIYSYPSTNGIIPKTPGLQFGIVDQMSEASQTNYAVGNNVLFDIADAKQIVYGSTQFMLLPENKIILIEAAAP